MKRTTLIGLIVAIILSTGIVGVLLGTAYTESMAHPFMRPPGPNMTVDHEFERAQQGFDLYIIAKTTVTVINIAIAIMLLAIYIGLYRQIKTEFTIGLFIVTFSLLVYALTSNPLIHLLFGFRWTGLGPFILISDLFATLALSVLLYISLK